MSEYQELMARHRELEIQIEEARRREMGAALEQVRSIIETYNLSPHEVFGTATAPVAKERRAVAIKYRDPATGQTWTGRGKPPRWISGAPNRDQYLAA